MIAQNSTNKTIWKVIPRSDEKYLVSNTGKVKSLVNKEEKILTPRITKYGYCEVGIRVNGFRKSRTVHRLVAKAFLEEKDSRPFVNHIDGNKSNNKIENLEYVTHAENIQHAHDKGLIAKNNGTNNGNSKLSETQVVAIKTLLEASFQNSFIAIHFGVNPTTISDIKRGKIWAWLKPKTKGKE